MHIIYNRYLIIGRQTLLDIYSQIKEKFNFKDFKNPCSLSCSRDGKPGTKWDVLILVESAEIRDEDEELLPSHPSHLL